MTLYRFSGSGSLQAPAPISFTFSSEEAAILQGGIMLERWTELGAGRRVTVAGVGTDGTGRDLGTWSFDEFGSPLWAASALT